MSTTTEVQVAEAHDADEAVPVHEHPSDLLYVKIALILAAITALEVGTYFLEDASTIVRRFSTAVLPRLPERLSRVPA